MQTCQTPRKHNPARSHTPNTSSLKRPRTSPHLHPSIHPSIPSHPIPSSSRHPTNQHNQSSTQQPPLRLAPIDPPIRRIRQQIPHLPATATAARIPPPPLDPVRLLLQRRCGVVGCADVDALVDFEGGLLFLTEGRAVLACFAWREGGTGGLCR